MLLPHNIKNDVPMPFDVFLLPHWRQHDMEKNIHHDLKRMLILSGFPVVKRNKFS